MVPPSRLVGPGLIVPILILGFSLGGDVAALGPSGSDTMIVPGGVESVNRLLGNVDTDPERFATSLNRVLLRTIRADHDWEAIEERADLIRYVDTLASLEAAFSFPLVFQGMSDSSRERLGSLCTTLGFELVTDGADLDVAPLDDKAAEGRRRAAWALGWSLSAIAYRIGRGETVTLTLDRDEVAGLLPASLSTSITGRQPTPESALGRMARDQRLGLVAEGRRRLTRETRERLSGEDLRWIHAHASVAFYRYAAAFEVRDGVLQLPGGPSSREAWGTWVGADPDDWRAFMRAALTRDDSRPVHVLGALSFVPEPVARYHVENLFAGPRNESRVDAILDALTSVFGRRFFTRARGIGPGFQLPFRAVRFSEESGQPIIPHGPALWLESLEDGPMPRTEAALAKSISQSMSARMDAGECLTLCMTHTSAESSDRFPVNRFRRTGHAFEHIPALLTPENVYLLNRAAAEYPTAVETVQRLEPGRPDLVKSYLMTVAGLDRNEAAIRLLAPFQGGVQLLALLRESGKVDGNTLDAAFEEWLLLFREEPAIAELPSARASWLRRLIEALPAADPSSPGRGPLERAWLAALAPGRDPQVFAWGGLTYEGRRARDRAARMLSVLEAEGIPPLDDVLRLEGGLAEILEAVKWLDLERVRGVAGRMLDGDPADEGPALVERSDRASDLARLLESLRGLRNPRKLTAFELRLGQALRLEAERVDPILGAPPYITVLSGIDNVLLADQRLIVRHEVFDSRAAVSLRSPAPWGPARLIDVTETVPDAYLTGHLGGVLPELIRLHVRSLIPGRPALQVAALPRLEWWYADAVRPSWSRVTPAALRRIATLVEAGDRELASALAEIETGGPSLDFVAAHVPRYRLDEEALRVAGPSRVTPSERLSLGLAVAAVGGGSARESSHAIGAPTPSLNGRYRPWVGRWLPYEALDRDISTDALVQRELIDIRIAVALFLARNDLPPEVGADLEMYAVRRAPKETRLESAEDWEAVLRWVARLDDVYFGEGMRWCLERSFYRLREF